MKRILVTGGAGFIGSHLTDALVEKGHRVFVLDNLDCQVHGSRPEVPTYLNSEAILIKGDIRHYETVRDVICQKQIEVIFHHAAAVGVGQSMYEIRHYVEVNSLGGANILHVIANESHRVEKVIVPSSMSIYGEGKYSCNACGIVHPKLRDEKQMEEREWETRCPHCSSMVKPLRTDEETVSLPTSIYAITKRDHEEMFLTVGRAYGIPTVALRYFNVYGPRQALSNPYTGVLAIFSSRLLNNKAPFIFEDGLQSRDFIHVSDVVQANILAMTRSEADYDVFNVGTGTQVAILGIAQQLVKVLSRSIEPAISGRFRKGDVRHCYADICKIKKKLGFEPSVSIDRGLEDLVVWLQRQRALDHSEQAIAELQEHKLSY